MDNGLLWIGAGLLGAMVLAGSKATSGGSSSYTSLADTATPPGNTILPEDIPATELETPAAAEAMNTPEYPSQPNTATPLDIYGNSGEDMTDAEQDAIIEQDPHYGIPGDIPGSSSGARTSSNPLGILGIDEYGNPTAIMKSGTMTTYTEDARYHNRQ